MDRRNFLAAGLVASVGVAMPVNAAPDDTAWTEAMQRFEACRSAEMTHDKLFWIPAYQANKAGGPAIPKHIDEEAERLIDLRCEAEDALIATPAPHLNAVIWKMGYSRQRWAEECGWPDDWLDAIMADLRRLAGES